MRRGEPELLAPAGSYEGVIAAEAAGADAVYVGGGRFGARAFAKNLSEEELLSAIDYMHVHGKKLYLTVNTLLKNREMEELGTYIAPLYEQGLDAVIVQDFGVLSYLSREFPELPLHASTQMTATGPYGVHALERHKVKRAVLARELSLDEIETICRNTDMEIECFVHGALCYCYSGQCLMSSILGGRSGNRGRCAQPCRLTYEAMQDGKPLGAKKGAYPLSPKDICTLELLPELLRAGVTSLKIEGRMKRAEYTAGVVSVYRKYLNLLKERGADGYQVDIKDMELLEKLCTRSGFSEGYLKDHNGPKMITLGRPDYTVSEEAFYEQFRKKYLEEKNQEKINGKVRLFKGMPATISLSFQGTEVEVSGGIVQEAMKQPLAAEKVESQVRKTGNTPFVLEHLEIAMDERVFLPVQELNALRREGLQKLEEALTLPYRRRLTEETKKRLLLDAQAEESGRRGKKGGKPSVSVSVETEGQLGAVLREAAVSDVYLSHRMFSGVPKEEELLEFSEKCRVSGKQCFFLLPPIFRAETAGRYEGLPEKLSNFGFDGAVARNIDELGFLTESGYTGEIRTDYSVYTMNEEARRSVRKAAIRDTLPLELNFKELRRCECTESELFVYGYVPLMVSAQCVEKTLGSCKKNGKPLVLKDRYQKQFTIHKDCDACMNIIYNSTPLVLLGCEDKIAQLAPKSIRLSFTGESSKETAAVLKAYIGGFLHGTEGTYLFTDFTRGHFNRGVD